MRDPQLERPVVPVGVLATKAQLERDEKDKREEAEQQEQHERLKAREQELKR
jgi:hypothetical protein